jgi:DNA-binding MarR family transcriptional regulator
MAEERLGNLLGALGVALSDAMQRTVEHAGGSAPTEPAALVTVANHPGEPIEALRRALGLTHSGAVRLVDRLETAGLLVRARAGPGRRLALMLTPAGEAAAGRIAGERMALLTDVVAGLTAAERRTLTVLLEKLLAELTGDRASARRICRLCDEPACERGADCPVDLAAGAPE